MRSLSSLSVMWNGGGSVCAANGACRAVPPAVTRFAMKERRQSCSGSPLFPSRSPAELPQQQHSPLRRSTSVIPLSSCSGLRVPLLQQKRLFHSSAVWKKEEKQEEKEKGKQVGDSERGQRENLLTVPNVLTVSRMAATPYLGWLLAQGDVANLKPALGLFFLAGFTDALDGWIARKWPSQATVIGGVIDPIADKFLICTVAVGLGYAGLVPVWLVALMFGRDAWLISGSLYIRAVSLRAHFSTVTWGQYWDFGYPTVIVNPTKVSKANTMVQGLVLLGSLISPIMLGTEAATPLALEAAWIGCGLTTFGSGASYLYAENALIFLRPPTDEYIGRLPAWARSRLESKKGEEEQ